MSFIAIKSKKNPTEKATLPSFDLDIPTHELRISDDAARRIRELRLKEGDASILRVGIMGGGCSGLSYSYSFEKEPLTSDILFHNGDVTVCVDPKSIRLIGGSVLHWQESMKRMGFQIINKQGRKSCSCGESFSI